MTVQLLEEFFDSGAHKDVCTVFSPESKHFIEKLKKTAIVGDSDRHVAGENRPRAPRAVNVVVFRDHVLLLVILVVGLCFLSPEKV